MPATATLCMRCAVFCLQSFTFSCLKCPSPLFPLTISPLHPIVLQGSCQGKLPPESFLWCCSPPPFLPPLSSYWLSLHPWSPSHLATFMLQFLLMSSPSRDRKVFEDKNFVYFCLFFFLSFGFPRIFLQFSVISHLMLIELGLCRLKTRYRWSFVFPCLITEECFMCPTRSLTQRT